MLFQVLGSDSDIYAIRQRIDVSRALPAAAVHQAWRRLITVHPMLRTRLDWTSGEEAVQVVEAHIEPTIDIIEVEPSGLDEAVGAFVAENPIDVSIDTAPSWRLTVFSDGTRSTAIWDHSHLLLDGWSAGLLMRQFLDLVEDPTSPIPIPTCTFGDYLEWMAARDDATDDAFWRRALDGLAQPTVLRSSHRTAAERQHRVSVKLDRGGSEALIGRLRRLRLTANTVTLAATAAVLGAHLGLDDVVLGVATAGRPAELEGSEAVVGMFTNTIVARVRLAPSQDVDTWLREIQFAQFDALEHQYTPFARITKLSPFPRDLTNVLFAHWGFGDDPRYRIREAAGGNGFPLSVVAETGDEITLHVDVDPSSVDPALGRALAARIVEVLEAVASGVGTVGELPAVPTGEIAGITSAAAGPTKRVGSIVDTIRDQAANRPDGTAIVSGRSSVSYERVDGSARGLGEILSRSSGPVALWMDRSPDLITAMLGCLFSGRPFIPISKHDPPARVASILEDAGAALLITSREAPSPTIDVLSPGAWEPSEWTPEESDPDSLAYIIYTSGSTGAPKGVPIRHRSLANYIEWASTAYGSAVSMPFFTAPGFDLTLTSILLPLTTGGTVVVYPDSDPLDMSVVDVFIDDRVDVVKLTPSHLKAVPDDALPSSRIRALVLGGEDLSTAAALRANVAGLVVFNEYGPTEATIGCMIHTFDPSTDIEPSVPIGSAIANTEIGIFDPTGRPVATGMDGELWVSGEGLTPGYLGRPDLDAAVFRVHGGKRWYRTGDQARWLRPGTALYLGRRDDQVKLRGARVELGEIEAVLAAHPGVDSAAVVMWTQGGRQLAVAYTVGGAQTEDIELWLRERLPAAMHPDRLVELAEMPLTINGKIDRERLPPPIDTSVASVGRRAPETDAEHRVAHHVADLLGQSQVDMEAGFFDLGGDSILAMQLVTRLRADFATEVSPRTVLLNSLGQIAAALGTTGRATSSVGVSVERRVLRFGPGLFGIQMTPLPTPVGTAVICPPYGWEYMRTHWALRQTARELVRRGWAVLRFDYRGTGDSAGAVDELTRLDDFVEDIEHAAAHIRSTGVPLVLVGARLGAALAVQAASRATGAERLVLWDPVVSGRHHLETISSINSRYLRRRFFLPQRRRSRELIGAPYPPALRSDLLALDLSTNAPPLPTTVISSTENQQIAALDAERFRVVSVPDVAGWDEPASVFTSVLPRRIPEAIAREVAGS